MGRQFRVQTDGFSYFIQILEFVETKTQKAH